MIAPLQSPAHNQKHFLSCDLPQNREDVWYINGQPIYHHRVMVNQAGAVPESAFSDSEYRRLKQLEGLKKKTKGTQQLITIAMGYYILQEGADIPLSEKPALFDYKEPLQGLTDKIRQVHDEHQKENWDGYGAKPVQDLQQALKFAKALFQESRLFIEKVDIIPENDGTICFEWFLSHTQYVAVSVKNNKLIYHYQLGEEKGCGETNIFGKQMLFEKIKHI